METNNKGFFVINNQKFKNHPENRHDIISKGTYKLNDNIKYIFGEDLICFGTNDEEVVRLIFQTYEHTNNDNVFMDWETKTFYFWFKVSKEARILINKNRLNQGVGKIKLHPSIETFAMNTETGAQGQFYLKKDGKERISDIEEFIEGSKNAPIVPLKLLGIEENKQEWKAQNNRKKPLFDPSFIGKKIVIYNGEKFFLENNLWTSINTVEEKDKALLLCSVLDDLYGNRLNEAQYKECYRYILKYNRVEKQFKGIVFLNGYVDKSGWHETNDIPFTTCQLRVEYDNSIDEDEDEEYIIVKEKPKIPEIEKYLHIISGGDPKVRKDLLKIWATCLANTPHEFIAVLWSEEPKTGKTLFIDIIKNFITLNNAVELSSRKVFSLNERFALKGIGGKTLGIFNELPAVISATGAETIKDITRESDIAAENKFANETSVEATQTWIATSNHMLKFSGSNLDEAIKSRLYVYEFPSEEPLNREEMRKIIVENQIKLILKELVEIYVEILKHSGSRNEIFEANQIDEVIEQINDEDPLSIWITENEFNLNGKEPRDIYAYANAPENKFPERIKQHLYSSQFITKAMKRLGWTQKKTERNTVYLRPSKNEIDKAFIDILEKNEKK